MECRKGDRIIALVDMDCFYVQVEQKLCPEFQNKPCAVVQYNTWKGGGIIAVNYEARAKGVSRRVRGDEALKACPDIHLFKVPEVRGKADLTRYREAGASVMEVLCKFSECVERASIDEAYIDLTEVIKSRMKSDVHVSSDQIPNTFVIGWEDKEDQKGVLQNWLQLIYEEDHLYNDRMLAMAAVIVEEMRAAVYTETGYRCSAGIARNKMLAKLICGLHKPNKQTVLPESSVALLYETIPVNKVRNLGGKFGEQVMETFSAKTMSDLLNLSKMLFISNFGDKNGNWLYNLSRGIENEPVIPRQLPKSIGCGKNFPGNKSLNTKDKVTHWVKQLSSELEERLLKDQKSNCRFARLLTVSVRNQGTPGFSTVSRSCPIYLYSAEKIAHDAFIALQKFNTSGSPGSSWTAILSLAMSASKFEDRLDNSTSDIQSYFNNPKSPQKKTEDTRGQDESDIDTVIELLDAESGLSNNSNDEFMNSVGNKISKDKIGATAENSNTCSRNKSSFFNVEVPYASNSASFEKESTPVVSLKPCASLTCHPQPSNISKLFEVTKENNMTNNIADNSKIATVDSKAVQSVCETQTPNDTEFKSKGFFARKLEEKSKAVNVGSLVFSDDLGAGSSKAENSSVFQHTWELISFSDPNVPGQSSSSLQHLTAGADNVLQLHCDDMLSDLDPELTKLCTKCDCRIPIWEEDEHSDYHFAMDLSKGLVKVSSVKPILPKANSDKTAVTKYSKTTRKRGHVSKSFSKSKKPAQQNTIDSFFK